MADTFRTKIYPMFRAKLEECHNVTECPGVVAERNGKTIDEICRACTECWNKIHQKQR